MKWWFKKPKKLNETTRLYALYGESANVEYLDSVDKETTARVDNLSTQLDETKANLQNLENKVNNKISERKMIVVEMISNNTLWEKIEIKPGLYLYTLSFIPQYTNTIATPWSETYSYYCEYFVEGVVWNGEYQNVSILFKKSTIFNQYNQITVNPVFEHRDKFVKWPSFISSFDWGDGYKPIKILAKLYPNESISNNVIINNEENKWKKRKMF